MNEAEIAKNQSIRRNLFNKKTNVIQISHKTLMKVNFSNTTSQEIARYLFSFYVSELKLFAYDHLQTVCSLIYSSHTKKGYLLAEIKRLSNAALLEPHFRVNRKRNIDNKLGKERSNV